MPCALFMTSDKADPIVVSFFTLGTLYEKEAASLRASCEKVGLVYRIEGIKPFGKWHQHTCYKPIYILQKMLELKRSVLWVDADAEIVQKPPFTFDCDIALRIFDAYPLDHPSHFYTGTIYFDYNPHTLRFVQAWAKAAQKAIRVGELTVDQQLFGSLIMKRNIRLYPLPSGYGAIFEEKLEKTFIVQYQASRLYKKIIDEEVALGIFDHLSVEELRQLRPRV